MTTSFYKPEYKKLLKIFFFPDNILEKISSEEYRKRIYVFTGLSIAIPVLLGFSLVSYFIDNSFINSLPDLLTAMSLFVIGTILRHKIDGSFIYRLAMIVLSSLFIYDVGTGVSEGGDIFWLYVYPLIAFFMFGTREGLIWIVAMSIPIVTFVIYPELFDSYKYSPVFKGHFFISIVLVTILAHLLESLRKYFYDQVQKQKAALQDALNNVNTLSGLLPICASCKKIRNDEGYWQSVDQYIATHTEAEFTHGICSSCLKDQSPKTYERLVKSGDINPDQQIDN